MCNDNMACILHPGILIESQDGKWGKHLWNLMLEILEDTKGLGNLMSKFPYWSNLQHFPCVSTVMFTDGQSFYDILKKVSTLYKKNFSFFKQHYIMHIISDIKNKGTTDNMLTCPGEGFQQEAPQAYKQTNKKKVKKQVSLFMILSITKYNLICTPLLRW
ncbi:hypothetical protein BDQ17DRAFT_1390310 [Cyathus striatus]|nr:hypothetical protein BDQ17DRAFT_1390310 [Cyathus striatus]